MTSDDPAARIGTLLRGKWRLELLLGVGGTGAVYAAVHRNGRRAAVKVFHAHVGKTHGAQQRALREGAAANRVRHAGAVAVLDDDVTDTGTMFIVMELLEGRTVDQLMSANPEPFPVPFVTQIGLELLDILAAAHLAGVVHRDVKPSNVFLLQGGSLKLVDFGVAYLTDTNEGDRITASGAIVGTPAFMSPEQARGRFDQVDARTDVWAVAAVLVTMLTRSELHRGTTKNEVLVSAATQPIPPIASLRADVPSTICEVLDRALSFSREDRYRDAGEMLVALRQAASRTRDHAAYRAREFVKTADTLITSNGGDSTTAELANSITDQQRHSRSIGHRVGVVGVVGALIIGGGLLSGLVRERRLPLPSLPTVTDSKVATVPPVVDLATIATSPPLASSPTMTSGIQLSPPASGRSTTTKVKRTRLAPAASVHLKPVAAPISSQAANPTTPVTNAIDPLDRR